MVTGFHVIPVFRYEDTKGKDNPAQNRIILHTQQKKTFFHELDHAEHAKFTTLKIGQISEQEIVAEFVAAVLCSLYGIEGFEAYSYPYIAGYAKAEALQLVVQKIKKVLSDVEKC